MVWLSICIVIWLLVSSTRAGGDQWDNPTIPFDLPGVFCLVCGWAWDYAQKNKDAWLGRFYLIEVIFLGFFLEWYISRYYQIIGRLPFEKMLIWVAGFSYCSFSGALFGIESRITARSKQLILSNRFYSGDLYEIICGDPGF